MSPVLAGRFFTICIHFSKESGCGYLSSFCVCVCMFCLKKCSPFFTLGGSPAHRIYILGLLWLKQEWPLPQPPPPRHSRGPLERGVKSPVEAKVLTVLSHVRILVPTDHSSGGTVKRAERQRTDVFELWCWRALLRVPWTARRSNQSILKISPGISLEGMMLKLKLQYFGHLM